MKKGLAACVFGILLILAGVISIANAETNLVFRQGSSPDLKVQCLDNNQSYCSADTNCNITINYPNSSNAITNGVMTRGSSQFNYTLNNGKSNALGEYTATVLCTGLTNGASTFSFIITSTGEKFDDANGNMLLAQIGLIGLFLAFGFSFTKEKWKLRSFFFIIALFIGVMLLNSLRVAAGGSSTMSAMANYGLIIGIIVLAFVIGYTLVFYTVEVFNYYKEKRAMRWETSGA